MAKIYGTPLMMGGGGGGQNLTLPPMVTNLAAVAGNQQITVTYKNPVSDALAGVLVVYKTGSYPTKPTDGKKVDAGLSESAVLEGLENDTDYYIRVFPYNSKKQYQTIIDGATTTARPSEGPQQVTNLQVSGSGASPVLTWKNPTDDPTYHETVVIQKVDSAPTSLSDGTEIYRGTGETATANGLEQLVNYYFGVFTVNTEGGTRGPVVSEVYRYDFPSEPTEWSEVTRISNSQEYIFPEIGWFKIVAVAGSGSGAYWENKYTEQGDVYSTAGGSGGSGGISVSKISTQTINKISITINNKNISISELNMTSKAGGNARQASSVGSASVGGSAGTANGGNVTDIKGNTGIAGQVFSLSLAHVNGGKSVKTEYEEYATVSGAGGGYNRNGETSPGSGSNAYVVILRGNTNVPSPSAASTLSLLPTDSTITVDWENSGDPVQTGTTLVYNADHVPTSANDGVSVDIPVAQATAATFAVDGEEQQADNKKQSYTITGLSNNKPVYVALFPYDANKKYGIPKTDVEIPRIHSWYETQQELQAEVATVKAEMADYQEYYVTTQEVLK